MNEGVVDLLARVGEGDVGSAAELDAAHVLDDGVDDLGVDDADAFRLKCKRNY